jgi:ketosteroid isomerase-like protein
MSDPQLAERYAQALITSDEATLNEICAPDVEFVVPGMTATGVAAMLDYNNVFRAAFPDAEHEIVERILSPEATVFEIVYRGTHTGAMPTPQGELPATGATVEIPGTMIVRTRDGKVVSFHGYFDQLSFLMQLGVMGQPA